MKKLIVICLASFLCSHAIARTTYEGLTPYQDPCFVTMNLENSNISFHSKGTGFGFIADESKITRAIQNGDTKITLEGGDAFVSAKLILKLSDQGELVTAIYKQKTFLIPKNIECHDLQERQ